MIKGLAFRASPQDWKSELQDIIHGASGGFLFGIPLIYTMEVWWIGSYTKPSLLLGVLAATFVLVLLLNRTDGFRRSKSVDWWQSVADSIEAIAIGIVCVTLVLVLLRQVSGSTPLDEALGKIIFEGVPFSIGVALARSLLNSDESSESDQASPDDAPSATFADIGATLVGTIIIAFNIAPTDEIPTLAAATSPPWLLSVIAASLVISYCIVFAAGFTTQNQRRKHQGLFQTPLTETSMAYLISLAAAAFMLWFFHRLDFSDPWTLWLRQTILLGLPATVGGAAGRLTT
jgi:putative integral membrane protein (TIGR02587 family)